MKYVERSLEVTLQLGGNTILLSMLTDIKSLLKEERQVSTLGTF